MASFNANEYRNQMAVAGGKRERAERRPCNLAARLAFEGHEIHCKIINLSIGGMGLLVDPIIKLHVGERLLATASEIGALVCILRWGAHPRYGAAFESLGPSSARIAALYDSLPSQQE